MKDFLFNLKKIDPELFENGTEKCCGACPTLRVRPKWQTIKGEKYLIPYVQYECRVCEKTGGLAMDDREARQFWNWKLGWD